jgi:hypothetical protein
LGPSLELTEMVVGGEKSILNGIFRIGRVAQKSVCASVQ